LQHAIAIVGIAAVFWPERFPMQLLHYGRRGHLVWLPHAHIDDLRARMRLERGAFSALDLFKFINGGGFAVLSSTQAVGEQALQIRFSHTDVSLFKIEGSRFKVQSSRFKVQSSRFNVAGGRWMFLSQFMLPMREGSSE